MCLLFQHIIFASTYESAFVNKEYRDYIQAFDFLLPTRGYNFYGERNERGMFCFPMDNSKHHVEGFYHYRLLWLNQLIKILKDEL